MDDIDVSILEALRKNGRLSMKALGELVSLSGSSTAERVKRLEEQEIIKGYHADIDYRKCGFPIHAFLHCHNPFSGVKIIDTLRSIFQEFPEIVSAYRFQTGGSYILVEIYCQTMERLEEIQQTLYPYCHTTTYLVSIDSLKEFDGKLYSF